MYEQITAGELDCLINYTPDREPTAQELQAIEQHELPSRRELIHFKLFASLSVEHKRTPNKKIILREETNEKDGYKRIIFNDWETIQELTPTFEKPLRAKKRELTIKIKSQLSELYQNIRFMRKQLQQLEDQQWRQPALMRMKIRNILRETLQEIKQHDKWLNTLRMA